jgi:hypothetical protein
MKRYAQYVARLEKLARYGLGEVTSFEPSLDGEPNRELRRLVSLTARRRAGAFFTGSKLSDRMAAALVGGTKGLVVADPTCGAGDLLIAAARRFEVEPTLRTTLRSWGKRLIGFDTVQEFVQSTQLRLCLLAIHCGAAREDFRISELAGLFPYIRTGDFHARLNDISAADVLMLNPPFTMVRSGQCDWSSGKVSAAAECLLACIENARPGTRVGAILPDVLRSGWRYGKWRQHIASRLEQLTSKIFGRFDASADIDVFILSGVVGENCSKSWPSQQSANITVGDLFNVHVGAVVPHRDRTRGPLHRYLHAKGLVAWLVVRRVGERRRFEGTVFQPPFVVVRRTSRPGDKYRAIATVISGAGPVAVENHLLVLSPKNGTLAACKRLATTLRKGATTTWLDARIRCRHLTVGSLREMPYCSDRE